MLQETSPDLLVLDVEMPDLNGLDLCRVVRNAPRWAGMPVLFLTAHTDTETIQRIFAAGADDYVTKPVGGPELLARITNRLERTQPLRAMVEVGYLTGAANRRKALEVLGQFLRLAARYKQHVSLAVLDVDHFKEVNDRFGHASGDLVLRRLVELPSGRFEVTMWWLDGAANSSCWACTV